MGYSTLLKPPVKEKLDGVVFLGFADKKSPLKIEMVGLWTFRLKTTSKQVLYRNTSAPRGEAAPKILPRDFL